MQFQKPSLDGERKKSLERKKTIEKIDPKIKVLGKVQNELPTEKLVQQESRLICEIPSVSASPIKKVFISKNDDNPSVISKDEMKMYYNKY